MSVPVALDPRLATYAAEYLAALYRFNPLLASTLGLHEYDGQVPDYALAPVIDRITALDHFIVAGDNLWQQAHDRWNAQDVRDWTLLTNAARSERRLLADQREHVRNPLFYDPLFDVTNYLKRDYAPLAERVAATIRHLDAIPDIVATADANLAAVVPAPFLATAAETVPGVRAFIADDLLSAIGDAISLEQHGEVVRAQARAVEALDRWQAALVARTRRATEEFAIGAEAFTAMLRWDEMVTMPLEDLLVIGEANLAANLARAHEIAARIDPHAEVIAAMASIGADHPTAEGLIPETRAMLESLRQFLIDHEIVTVPSEVRCRVEETPPFLRWASAMMDAPGPLDERATEAFYYVTPVEPTWSAEQQEEWLRTLNYTMLRNTSVHEAYPGHYVHSLHNRMAPTQVSRVFGAYSFWEAWAHYAEEMMIDAGLGDGDPRLHLAQLGDALLRNVRFVCAIRMHTMGMTVAEATVRFEREAFLEPLAAEREVMRGTFDPGYLCYTLGKLELLKLRRDVQHERGAAFTLKQFHDDVLSFGAPPLALVRAAMLRNDDGQVL